MEDIKYPSLSTRGTFNILGETAIVSITQSTYKSRVLECQGPENCPRFANNSYKYDISDPVLMGQLKALDIPSNPKKEVGVNYKNGKLVSFTPYILIRSPINAKLRQIKIC